MFGQGIEGQSRNDSPYFTTRGGDAVCGTSEFGGEDFGGVALRDLSSQNPVL